MVGTMLHRTIFSSEAEMGGVIGPVTGVRGRIRTRLFLTK